MIRKCNTHTVSRGVKKATRNGVTTVGHRKLRASIHAADANVKGLEWTFWEAAIKAAPTRLLASSGAKEGLLGSDS